MTFRSTGISGTKDEFQLTGDLTIRGVTRPITLDVTFEGEGKDPWGGTRASFSAKGKFDRRDFGLTWNVALETGGILVSNEVKINIEAQVVAQGKRQLNETNGRATLGRLRYRILARDEPRDRSMNRDYRMRAPFRRLTSFDHRSLKSSPTFRPRLDRLCLALCSHCPHRANVILVTMKRRPVSSQRGRWMTKIRRLNNTPTKNTVIN